MQVNLNFDKETFKSAIKYAHIRDVKVYMTMNTLVSDKEIKNAIDAI